MNSYNRKQDSKMSGLEISVIILFLIAFSLMISMMFFSSSKVISGSMENTIMTNTRLISTKNPKEIKRNDIIIFNYEDEEIPYAKRVIGIPGDEIVLEDGLVYINGELETLETVGKTYAVMNEYFSERKTVYLVPDNAYFVMGDNREYSFDSREFENTYITKQDIIGKAMYKFSLFNDNNKLYFKKLN